MTQYIFTGLVTLLTLAVYFWMAMNVGKARAKHAIKAPEMTGPEEFNRVMRVFANTREQFWLFFPLLWLFAGLWGDFWAAILGVIFPIARIIYAHGYYQEAPKRGRGFAIGFILIGVLFVGVLIGYAIELYDAYL